jgi:hypothetical protein
MHGSIHLLIETTGRRVFGTSLVWHGTDGATTTSPVPTTTLGPFSEEKNTAERVVLFSRRVPVPGFCLGINVFTNQRDTLGQTVVHA